MYSIVSQAMFGTKSTEITIARDELTSKNIYLGSVKCYKSTIVSKVSGDRFRAILDMRERRELKYNCKR